MVNLPKANPGQKKKKKNTNQKQRNTIVNKQRHEHSHMRGSRVIVSEDSESDSETEDEQGEEQAEADEESTTEYTASDDEAGSEVEQAGNKQQEGPIVKRRRLEAAHVTKVEPEHVAVKQWRWLRNQIKMETWPKEWEAMQAHAHRGMAAVMQPLGAAKLRHQQGDPKDLICVSIPQIQAALTNSRTAQQAARQLAAEEVEGKWLVMLFTIHLEQAGRLQIKSDNAPQLHIDAEAYAAVALLYKHGLHSQVCKEPGLARAVGQHPSGLSMIRSLTIRDGSPPTRTVKWSIHTSAITKWKDNNKRNLTAVDVEGDDVIEVGWAWVLLLYLEDLCDTPVRPGHDWWEWEALRAAVKYRLYDTSVELAGYTLYVPLFENPEKSAFFNDKQNMVDLYGFGWDQCKGKHQVMCHVEGRSGLELHFHTPGYLQEVQGHHTMQKRAKGLTPLDMKQHHDKLICDGNHKCPYAQQHGEHRWTYGGDKNPPESEYWRWAWGKGMVDVWTKEAVDTAAAAKAITTDELVVHMLETPSGTGSASVSLREGDSLMSFDIDGYCKVPGGYTFPEYKQDLRRWDGVKACRLMEAHTKHTPDVLLHPQAISCVSWNRTLNIRNGKKTGDGARHRDQHNRAVNGGEGQQADEDSQFKSNMFKQTARMHRLAWKGELYSGEAPN
jgi:hypothetical protein